MADTGISAARRGAAANTTGAKAGAPCPNCVKQGLAILPVVSGIMPNSETTPSFLPLSSALLSLSDPIVANELAALAKGLTSKDLSAHWYFMRALPAGYLYVYKPNGSSGQWDAYLVDRSGLLRAVAPNDKTLSPADAAPLDQPAVCSRSEHNNLALQYFVVDPVKHPEIWLGFSRHRWTTKVMDAYGRNEGNIRDKRMTKLDVTAAAEGKLGNYEGSPVPHGMKMTAGIGGYVADYASSATRAKINGTQVERLYDRGDSMATVPRKPTGAAAALAEEMRKSSQNTEAKLGAVVLLHDVVGVTQQLNAYRNKVAAEACVVSGMGDPAQTRKRAIADIIEGIRANAETNPGPWWDRNYGPERYLKHINESDWSAAKQSSTEFKSLLEKVKTVSADYCAVKESEAWKLVNRLDFDETDHESALDHGRMVAHCVAGSGRTKLERDLVWYPALEMDPTNRDNWLMRALGSDHKAFLEYLAGNPGDQDEAFDTVKEAQELSGSYIGKGLVQINAIRIGIRNQRAANEALATVIETSAGILFNLRRDNPKAYRKLLRSVTLALITRDDVIPQPVVVKGAWSRISAKIMEVATGAPRISARAPIGLVPNAGRGPYLATKGNLGATGWGLSDGLEGAVVMEAPTSKSGQAQTVAWVVHKLEDGEQLNRATLRRLGLDELDLTTAAGSADNPFQRNHLKVVGQKITIGMNAGALFFQGNALVGAMCDYFGADKEDRDGGALADASVGVGVAIIAGIGAAIDLKIAVQSMRGLGEAATSVAERQAARWGLVAGIIEGLYAIGKGASKVNEGDVDSGMWTMASGAALIAGSLAAYGATTGTVLGIGVSLGPVGWALLIIGFLGLALYCAWQAFGTDEENMLPVEYWLDNGIFGKGEHKTGKIAKNSPYYSAKSKSVQSFASLQDEIYGLQKVTLVAQARFGVTKDRGNYSLHFRYNVTLPRYAKGSCLELNFTAIYKGKRISVGGVVCEDGKDRFSRSDISSKFTGMREDPSMKIDKSGVMELSGYFSTLQDEVWVEKLIEWLSGTEANPDAQYADAMELSGTYWPDKSNLPGLSSTFEYPPKK
ncbi:hypothetical protein SAMN04487939_10688 [Lysobacter sp. yr284]|uniref:T6SS effector BTH_I2691 family protein n=1 Tax=Lysobacter sp. yr284 TaxID=1761791 RepID=UPI00089C5D68|nr:T6SS effector BTH_I2691 family protein [Lysobacter sp. yr284]SDY78850.1 hypothetical protein SAMN04487939_10688 [Lysobacter sp. yr284]